MLIIVFFVATECSGQELPIATRLPYPLPKDTTTNKICNNRGHVISGFLSETLIYCPPYTIDTDSTTIQVLPNCNSIMYACGRCMKNIVEQQKEVRIVIWKIKKKN